MNKYFTPLLLPLILLCTAATGICNGVDSVRTLITPVQCFGMRNGVIHVDDVYGGLEPYYYSLDGESFTTNPTFDRLWAGNYTLSVRDGSGEIKEWKITIKEPAALSVKLELSKDQISAGEPFGIRAITSAEREFLQTITWSPEELFIKQDTLRHWLSIFETTQISVQVTDQNGCVDSDILTVETGSTPLYFPNAINTGNSGDNGYFTLFAGEGVKQIASMQIYSRGGGLVFERNNFPPNAPGLGWNGRWDGRFVHPGVYPYLVMVEFVDGKLKRFQGTVTVVN